MAGQGGRGPAPKEPSRRARRNADPAPAMELRWVKGKPPSLPAGVRWPERTRKWWKTWAASPQAEHFTQTDWEVLMETALIHALFWEGDISLAAELRLRVAKFGATPEDRLRLRMRFADTDAAEAKRPNDAKSSRERYADLRVLRGGRPASGE